MKIIYCISFTGLFSARALQHMMDKILSQRQLLPTHDSAQVPALPRGMLRGDQTAPHAHQGHSNRNKRHLAGGTDTSSDVETAHSTFAVMLQVQMMAKQKKLRVSNFHLSREHFVRLVNMAFHYSQ